MCTPVRRYSICKHVSEEVERDYHRALIQVIGWTVCTVPCCTARMLNAAAKTVRRRRSIPSNDATHSNRAMHLAAQYCALTGIS